MTAEGDAVVTERVGAATDRKARARVPFTGALLTTGAMVAFGIKAVREIPGVLRHELPEVLRHAGVMVRMHLPVVVLLAGMMGAMLGIVGSFVFESIGLDTYVAIIIGIPLMRGILAVVFGWTYAAKAGCGIVAELGAMRINEEIDALEVMGVPSISHLVATRLAASILVLPAMYTLCLFVHYQVAQFFFVQFLGTVSEGGYEDVLYSLQGPNDLAFTIAAGSIVGFLVTLVAGFFGYNASGGPVGVGRSTAQSMLVNLVLIGLTVMILVQAFYGAELVAPIGN